MDPGIIVLDHYKLTRTVTAAHLQRSFRNVHEATSLAQASPFIDAYRSTGLLILEPYCQEPASRDLRRAIESARGEYGTKVVMLTTYGEEELRNSCFQFRLGQEHKPGFEDPSSFR